MTDTVTRAYEAPDMDACLAIFDSNTPAFFAPEERDDFARFLTQGSDRDRPYLVLERTGTVIACAGLIVEAAARQAIFAWGMVDRRLHREGLGTRLVQARLALARDNPIVEEVLLDTSQHTHGFYETFGFEVTKVTPDGYAPRLDRWDMRLRIPRT